MLKDHIMTFKTIPAFNTNASSLLFYLSDMYFHRDHDNALRPRPLLLSEEERVEGDVGHLDDLEPDARDVADGMALPAKPGHQHLVVLLHEVETAVLGHEGRDLLAVLDQLDADALADGGVGLLGLNTNL